MEGKALELETVEDYKILLHLIACGYAYVYRSGNKNAVGEDGGAYEDRILRFALNCNDVFYYACTDLTEFDLHDTRELAEMHEKFPGVGITAWCARDRGETPIREILTEDYYAAYEYTSKFFADEYEYILITTADQMSAVREFIAGRDYTAQYTGTKQNRWLIRVTLSENEFHRIQDHVSCVYRLYGGSRVKETQYSYIYDGEDNSVYSTRKAVAKALGLDYQLRTGFQLPQSQG